MAGKSEREKAASRFYNEISALNPNVQNRFDNYTDPYSIQQIENNYNLLFDKYRSNLNREYEDALNDAQRKAMQNLASRGITSGSILTDTISGAANQLNKNKLRAYEQLNLNQLQALSDLMRWANTYQLQKTQAAQNVDMANLNALFNKYGLQGQAMQGLDDTTWLDDVFAGMLAGGQLAQGIGSIVRGVKSDRRLKENIEKITEIDGINVYKFNFIGDDDTYIGVIADEVEHIDGVVEIVDGYKVVNYDKLGIPFVKIEK